MGHFLLLEKTCLIIGLASYCVDMSFFCFRVFFSKYFLWALSPAQMKIVTHYRQTHFWRSLQNLSNGDELQSTPSQTRRITRKKWKKCKFLLLLIFQTSKYSCLMPFPCHDTAYMFNCFCSEHFDKPAWQIPQCPTDHTIFGVLWQFLREIISKLQMKSDPKKYDFRHDHQLMCDFWNCSSCWARTEIENFLDYSMKQKHSVSPDSKIIWKMLKQ